MVAVWVDWKVALWAVQTDDLKAAEMVWRKAAYSAVQSGARMVGRWAALTGGCSVAPSDD